MTKPIEEAAASSSASVGDDQQKAPLFSFMSDHPWPFLIILPIAFILLIAFGWSSEDKIEQQVANLWIPRSGEYAQDQAFAAALGVDDLSASSFAAMAISRDAQNIMTAVRLEEIRARMQAAESTTVRCESCCCARNLELVCPSHSVLFALLACKSD